MPEGTVTMLQCPSCGEGANLVAVERSGVVVDACPRCRGVWLDRGELDKLIDLEARASADFLDEIQGGSRRAESGEPEPGEREHDDRSSGDHGSESSHGSKRKRRRGSFLGEFLDFG